MENIISFFNSLTMVHGIFFFFVLLTILANMVNIEEEHRKEKEVSIKQKAKELLNKYFEKGDR